MRKMASESAGSAPDNVEAAKPKPEMVKPVVPASPVVPEEETSSGSEAGGEEANETDDPEGGVTLKLVKGNWTQILALARRKNPQTAALLRSGRLLGVKNGAVYFGFSEVLKSRMEKSENMDVALQVFQEILEIEVPIRCVVSTGKAGKLPPDVDGDGMVAAALRDLGGEIVDIQ